MSVGLVELVGAVPDPEIPVVTVGDLGIVRDVRIDGDGRVEVTITPTYSGCPAMTQIADDIRAVVNGAGYPAVEVRTALSPAWTTDWITQHGRDALREYGIAPPSGSSPALAARGRSGPVALPLSRRGPVVCPRCGSADTRLVSQFGSTACKAHHVCRACLEPFDEFKAL